MVDLKSMTGLVKRRPDADANLFLMGVPSLWSVWMLLLDERAIGAYADGGGFKSIAHEQLNDPLP